MDQKKTFWILAAVGVFLLVVLGAALIFYSPSRNNPSTAVNVAPVEKPVNSSGWSNPPVSNMAPVAGQQPVAIPQNTAPATEKVNDMIVLADNTTVYGLQTTVPNQGTTIDLNALKHEMEYTGSVQQNIQPQAPAAQPQNINITVNIPETKEIVNTVIPPRHEGAPVKKYEKPAEKPVEKKVEKPVQKAPAPKPAASSAKPKPAAPAAAKPAVTRYWVQVAAYSNKKGAENARSILDANKIPADIFTFKDNKDRMFYRVRVGPYTTKSEAEYWRTRIIKINEFSKAESFVTSTTE